MMATREGIHWRAPAAMITALLAGVLFAVAHHLFYRSLAGNAVPPGSYRIAGIAASPQQVNIAAGTAFAFLVKSCLATTIAIAYSQLMWNTAFKKPVRLTSLDAVSTSLGNAFQLLYLATWWDFRFLFLLAIVAW